MNESLVVDVFTMIWYGYLLLAIFLLLAVSVWVFKNVLFFKSSGGSERLNLDQEENNKSLCQSEKKNETSEVLCNNVTNKDLSSSNTDSSPCLKNTKVMLNVTTDDVPELSKFIDTNDYVDKVNRDILSFHTSLEEDVKDTVNKESVTVCNGFNSSEDEMYESMNYTTGQNNMGTVKLNSTTDSCIKEISQLESEYINCFSSENSETETIEKPKTYFTERRKRKSTTNIQNVNSEKHLCSVMIEDNKSILNAWNSLKNEFDILENNRERPSLGYEQLKKELDLKNIERTLSNDKLEYDLENTKHSLNDNNWKIVNNLETTEISSISHNELENEEHSLKNHEQKLENDLETTGVSSMCNHELENEYSLKSLELAYLNDDDWKLENNLETTEISCISHGELENEYMSENVKNSLNDDEQKLENDLETTGVSSMCNDELENEYSLKSLELTYLSNDESMSCIEMANNKLTLDYEVQGITELNSTNSSSEYTESLPSTIHSNDNSINDIQYVEDYNDISFFDSTLSDDAMNEAFIED